MESIKKAVIILIHLLFAWVFCSIIFGIAGQLGSEQVALITYTIITPAVFVVVSISYFKDFNYTGLFLTAVIFVALYAVMDILIISWKFGKKFEIYDAMLRTWVPYGLTFFSIYFTGRYCLKEPKKADGPIQKTDNPS
ncbi:hypothetical protein ACFLQ1_00550 [Candidatus Auribacterota bacterium]